MSNDESLILVHVLFRHGERTPDTDYYYPNGTGKHETFEPYGSGNLTNEGKTTMYELGKDIRRKYDIFLGPYRSHLCEFWSSGYDRAKTSLNAFLAGLYPPSEELQWRKELIWDPLPSHHIRREDDELFLSTVTSQKYIKLYTDNFNYSKEGKALSEKFKGMFEYIKKNTGYEHMTTRHVSTLRGVLITRLEYGLELPEWVTPDHLKAIKEIALYENAMQLGTNELKKLCAGKLFNKILHDTKEKVDGSSSRLIHVYSGHDINIEQVLGVLGIMFPHFPPYGACIVFEVYDIHGEHVFKILYKQHKYSDFKTMVFPNGKDTYPLQEFEKMVTKLMSANVEFNNDFDIAGRKNLVVNK